MSDHSATAEPAQPHGQAHDDHGHHGSLFQHAKPYIMVGAALFVLTLITVGLSYIDFAHYSIFRRMFAVISIHDVGINIVIGMIVATGKVCLVGWYFMHLKQEKAGIWRPLFFTFFFCLGLFVLCLLAKMDPIPTTSHPLH